jgi:hypothetical protein
MGTSVVYSSILSAVMASIRTIRPKPIIFDTAVGDLTDQLSEPSGALQGRPTCKAALVIPTPAEGDSSGISKSAVV